MFGRWVRASFAGWAVGFLLILVLIAASGVIGLGATQFPVGLGMGLGVGAAGVTHNVGAFMPNVMVPMGSDTAATVPYLLLGGGLLTAGGEREAAAGLGMGVIVGRGPAGFFLEVRALSSQWPRVLATAGTEF